MTRNQRQWKILEIIRQEVVETQEELVNALRSRGFDVTQATISRDIKDLGLIKTQTESGAYKYVTKQSMDVKVSGKLLTLFKDCFVSAQCAGNVVVVKTVEQCGNVASEVVEQMGLSYVLGVVGSKDTAIAVCTDNSAAAMLVDKLNQLQY